MHTFLSVNCARLNRLTNHNGAIPENEIWIKIGGDKGGKSVKANFQICNVENPNSVRNTCVFAVFEAPDSATNVHIALERYSPQISELARAKWRYIQCC